MIDFYRFLDRKITLAVSNYGLISLPHVEILTSICIVMKGN